MIAVLQRVLEAKVVVDGKVVGQIGHGILALVAVAQEDSQPDVTADIYHTGIILTGGGALLNGMSERLQKELCLHVVTADAPLAAVALGAGRLLAEPEKLQRASIPSDVPAWQMSEELIVNW